MTGKYEENVLIRRLRIAAVVMENLPEYPGYNGSMLTIDDNEAVEIANALDASADALEDAAEAVEILDNLINSIKVHGNYSDESTLGFLNAARQCLRGEEE
jgi:hypothetical protein